MKGNKIIGSQTRSLKKSKRVYVWCDDQRYLEIGKRIHVRCPSCGRRLFVRQVPGGFRLPPHKHAIKEGRT
jgi:DNA-directed RNA polymerase subunit RPC12/RpoP